MPVHYITNSAIPLSNTLFKQYIMDLCADIVWKDGTLANMCEVSDINELYLRDIFMLANNNILKDEIVQGYPIKTLKIVGAANPDSMLAKKIDESDEDYELRLHKYSGNKFLMPSDIRAKCLAEYTKNLNENISDINSAIDMDTWHLKDDCVYEEKNNYYRMLNGLPNLEDTDYIYNDNAGEPIYTEKDQEGNFVWRIAYKLEDEHDENSAKIIDTDGVDENGNPLSVPLHKLSRSVRLRMERSGVFDTIMKKYPTKLYVKYCGKRQIKVYDARSANRFDLLYHSLSESDLLNDEFETIYSKCKSIVNSVYYNNALRKANKLYDNFLAMTILFMTVEYLQHRYLEVDITRDFYDLESLKLIYDSYGVPFYEKIPIEYHRDIVKNMNKLVGTKGSSEVFLKLFELFTAEHMKLYTYYLVRTPKQIDLSTQYYAAKIIKDKYNAYDTDCKQKYEPYSNKEKVYGYYNNNIFYTSKTYEPESIIIPDENHVYIDLTDNKNTLYAWVPNGTETGGIYIEKMNYNTYKAYTYINPEGEIELKHADDKLYFSKGEFYGDPSTNIRDMNNDIAYDDVTKNDPYWIKDTDLKDHLEESEFNYTETKYIGVQTIFDLMKMVYEHAYIFKLITDNIDDYTSTTAYQKREYDYYSTNNPNHLSFDWPEIGVGKCELADIIIYIASLYCNYYGYSGAISASLDDIEDIHKLDISEIGNVYGYNFEIYDPYPDKEKVHGYYYNDEFYKNKTHTITIHVDGYYYNDEFYQEEAHTTLITPDANNIYFDLSTGKKYKCVIDEDLDTAKYIEVDRYNKSNYVEDIVEWIKTVGKRQMRGEGSTDNNIIYNGYGGDGYIHDIYKERSDFINEQAEADPTNQELQDLSNYYNEINSIKNSRVDEICKLINDMDILNVSNANERYLNIVKLRELVSMGYVYASTLEEFEAYRHLYLLLLESEHVIRSFTSESGNVYQCFASVNSDVDSMLHALSYEGNNSLSLYNRYVDVVKYDVPKNAAEQQESDYVYHSDRVGSELMLAIDKFEAILKDIEFMNLTAGINSNHLLNALYDILRFFKSAKAEIVEFNLVYEIKEKGANFMKFMDKMLRAEYVFTEPINDGQYNGDWLYEEYVKFYFQEEVVKKIDKLVYQYYTYYPDDLIPKIEDTWNFIRDARNPDYTPTIFNGYYNENKFYEDSKYEQEITPDDNTIYMDNITGSLYRWDNNYIELTISDNLSEDENPYFNFIKNGIILRDTTITNNENSVFTDFHTAGSETMYAQTIGTYKDRLWYIDENGQKRLVG